MIAYPRARASRASLRAFPGTGNRSGICWAKAPTRQTTGQVRNTPDGLRGEAGPELAKIVKLKIPSKPIHISSSPLIIAIIAEVMINRYSDLSRDWHSG